MSDRWWHEAACAGMDVNVFYGSPGRPRLGELPNARAKAVCAQCSVRAECLRSALTEERSHNWTRFGVRGGLTADERRKLARIAA